MGSMFVRLRGALIVSIGVALALWHVPAHADMWPMWQRITTDQGCIATIYDYNDPEEPGNWRVYHWTGRCTAGAAINGQGSLQGHFMDYGERTVTVQTGTMIDGYFDGTVTDAYYDVDAQGRWDSTRPAGEVQRLQFHRGCRSDAESCDSERGDVYKARLYGAGLYRDINESKMAEGSPVSGDGSSSASGGSGSTVKVATANGDIFKQCVRLESLGQPGIEMLWTLTNACNAKIQIAYCFKSGFPALESPNLCMHNLYRSTALAPGENVEFAYNTLADGTAMSDGRMAQGDQLEVVGHGCANGNSPGVRFDDKQFVFTGC